MAQHAFICPVMVGRSSQVDAITALATNLRAQNGQFVIISGEAGIGKSRLIAEATARLCAELGEHPLVLQGRCYEFDQVLPFAPLFDILRGLLLGPDGASMARAITAVAPKLAEYLPELAPATQGKDAPSSLEPEAEKRQIFWALTRCFLALAAQRPLVLVIEDAHWSDESSLRYLLTLASRLRDAPIVVLLTHRSEHEYRPLQTFLGEMARERLALAIRLEPLDQDETARMAREILGASDTIPTPLSALLAHVTDGNPFYIEETIASLQTSGALTKTGGAWVCRASVDVDSPPTVQAAVQQRVQRLDPETQDVVTVMAAMGRRSSFALLQQVTGRDEASLLKQVKALIEATLIVEESASVLSFRHAMIRQAIYYRLLGPERQALHRQIATALLSGSVSASASDLATHFAAAGMWEQTLTYARQAGDQARAVDAPYVAIEHYSRAIAAARLLRLPVPLDLLRDRAMMYQLAGERALALRDLQTVEKAAASAGDRQAQWQNALDLGYFYTSNDFPLAITYLKRAHERARELGDQSILAQTMNRVGNWYANSDQPAEALRYHNAALELFATLGDTSGLAATYDLIATAGYIAADLEEGIAAYQKAIELWRELDNRGGLISSLGMFALCRVPAVVGVKAPLPVTLAACQRAAEEALTLAREVEWRPEEAFARSSLAYVLAARGAYGEAYEQATMSLEIAANIEHSYFMTFSEFALGLICLETCDYQMSRQHLVSTLRMARQIGSRFWTSLTTALLAQTLCAEGEVGEARVVLDTEPEPAHDTLTLVRRHLLLARAAHALAAGEPERALASLDPLADPDGQQSPRLERMRAEVLLRMRRFTEAAAVARGALPVAEAGEMVVDRMKLVRTLGQAQHALGMRKEAHETFALLRSLIAELAGRIPVEATRERFLRVSLAGLPNGERRPLRRGVAPSDLTTREREVAGRIAQGKTNRAIAADLVLSERTVEKYVERISSKLGVSSRASIAAWMATNSGSGSAMTSR